MSNQCDGCRRGLPVSELGFHRTDTEIFSCTRARQPLAREPKAKEAWHQPAKRAKSDVPCTFGGAA